MVGTSLQLVQQRGDKGRLAMETELGGKAGGRLLLAVTGLTMIREGRSHLGGIRPSPA